MKEGGEGGSRREANVNHDTVRAGLLREIGRLASARHRVFETSIRELARDLALIAIIGVANDHAESLFAINGVRFWLGNAIRSGTCYFWKRKGRATRTGLNAVTLPWPLITGV